MFILECLWKAELKGTSEDSALTFKGDDFTCVDWSLEKNVTLFLLLLIN